MSNDTVIKLTEFEPLPRRGAQLPRAPAGRGERCSRLNQKMEHKEEDNHVRPYTLTPRSHPSTKRGQVQTA